ncbi:MAG: DUF1573 domain-containing protein [Bacteroidota bacterium]
MGKVLMAVSACLLLFTCQFSSEKEKGLTEIRIDDQSVSNASIIRNPVTADQPLDTINVAKMTFENIRHRYGVVEPGTIVRHTWPFTNTGKAPLIISDVKSTCGCTVPEWPKEPIPVGGTGEITVKFDTEGKEAYQTKPIFITANTHPSKTTLYLMGEVRKSK